MARTRSTRTDDTADAAAGPATPAAPSESTSKAQAGPAPKLLILPKLATREARVVLLPHPRRGRPTRYLVCPEAGIYEFTKVAAPRTSPKSWLIETHADASDEDAQGGGAAAAHHGAQIATDADLYMATAFDPLFLILPALADGKAVEQSDDKRRLFLSSDDYLDGLPEESSHLSEILRWRNMRALIESRMAAVCDSVEAGDETMFRLNEEKLLTTILEKAKKMGEGGMPQSMEDRFVTRVLEAPVVVSSQNGPGGESSGAEPDGANDAVATAAEAPPDVVNLQRLRVAFDFICSNYISPHLAERLQLRWKGSGCTDFSALEEYLAKVARLRAEAAELGSFADFSQKRARDEGDDEARAEKKRMLEEDKKRKASESRGVRELKKVNTSGMKKLSAFFKPK